MSRFPRLRVGLPEKRNFKTGKRGFVYLEN